MHRAGSQQHRFADFAELQHNSTTSRHPETEVDLRVKQKLIFVFGEH
jgi:hypothetical protein